MQFNILGPLEVLDRGTPIAIKSGNQRATLGFLLLHANSVVATRSLITALWRQRPPATARKILQNAIGGLRATLSTTGTDTTEVELLTHAPGYLLRVDPQRIDLNRFQALAEVGRAELADGAWERAAATLGEALSLWRGPALVDLTESGVDWPELTALHEARLTALENKAEAELALGRHNQVIIELENEADARPLRERMRGLLMIALYRAGRQSDALAVYRRTRIELATQFGLEPGKELQLLEQAILSHDPELALPVPGIRPPVMSAVTATRPDAPASAPASGLAPVSTPPTERAPEHVRVERKWVSALLVQIGTIAYGGTGDPEDIDKVRRRITAVIREQVERFGGVLHTTVGPMWLAVFGVPRTHEDDAERAVRAGFAIRGLLVGGDSDIPPQKTVRAAVATGETLMTTDCADNPSTEVTGEVLTTGMRLLNAAKPGELRVCPTTRQASPGPFTYAGPGGTSDVIAVRPEHAGSMPTVAFVGREREQARLRSVLEEVTVRRKAQLFTILGEPGIGKSRLAAEFALASSGDALHLFGRVPRFGYNSTLAPLAGALNQLLAGRSLETLVKEHFSRPDQAEAVLRDLRPLVRLREDVPASADTQAVCRAWRRLMAEVASRRPLVVTLENLQWAEDTLLDFVEQLDDHVGPVPLLIVVTARPELLHRRPAWGGGKHNATIITLDPLPDGPIDELLAAMMVRYGIWPKQRPAGALRDQVAYELGHAVRTRIGGNPLFALQYVRLRQHHHHAVNPWLAATLHIDSAGPVDSDDELVPVPQAVHNIIAAQLDTLSSKQKAILQDAAVLGDTVHEDLITLLSGRDPDEVARCLRYLDRRGFLTRVHDSEHTAYVFQHLLVRDIAYSQMSRVARAEKHYRCAVLLEGRVDSALSAHHLRRANMLAAAAGISMSDLLRRIGGTNAGITPDGPGITSEWATSSRG